MTFRYNWRFVSRWILFAFLAAFSLSRTPSGVIDLDLFHEMALARETMELGYVPWTDSFSYTPTIKIVVHHEWGLGLIAFLLGKLLGGTGIILLKFFLLFGLGSVIWRTARQRGAKPLITALFVTLGIVLSDFGFATVRAQMVSYLFTALLLRGFDLDRQGNRRWIAGLIVLFPIWANIHGGCLVGAALFAAHWLEQYLRRQPHWHLFIMGLALVPLAAVNPWGFHFHQYLLHAMTMPRPAIAEWSPLWDAENRHQFVNFGISLLPVFLILKKFGGKQIPGLLVVVLTGFAALKSNRFLPFYAIAYASYLPAAFSQTEISRELRRLWWRFQPLICTGLGLLAVSLSLSTLSAEPWRLRVPSHLLPHHGKHLIYPVGAVRHLQSQDFRGNIMVPYDWGSYVMWKLGPNVKVSFDSRYEVAYPTWRMDEDDIFFDARDGWEKILSKYPTDVVLARRDLRIIPALEKRAGWNRIYSDPQFVLFARADLKLTEFETTTAVEDGQFP